MKNFKLNKRNVGATSIASKACAWILSIMLVVTGMAPSFAANSKNVSNGAADSYVKNVAKKDEASSKKLDKKDTSATKKLDKKLSFQKILKDTNNENAKKKIFKNRRNQQFNLNASGNVNATLMNGDLSITVKNSSGDANIDRSLAQAVDDDRDQVGLALPDGPGDQDVVALVDLVAQGHLDRDRP